MEIEGKIVKMLPSRGGTSANGNTWVAQSFVLEYYRGDYRNYIALDVFGADKIDMFKLQVGENIRAHFDINAHEFKEKWYNDLRVWKVDRIVTDASPTANVTPYTPPSAQPSPAANVGCVPTSPAMQAQMGVTAPPQSVSQSELPF